MYNTRYSDIYCVWVRPDHPPRYQLILTWSWLKQHFKNLTLSHISHTTTPTSHIATYPQLLALNSIRQSKKTIFSTFLYRFYTTEQHLGHCKLKSKVCLVNRVNPTDHELMRVKVRRRSLSSILDKVNYLGGGALSDAGQRHNLPLMAGSRLSVRLQLYILEKYCGK